ncbi:MAG: hypothetical protein P8L85_11645 [Rubripirellula sp.]|nr:hypothetical protein [Rubripirellula sp.]
MSSHLRSSFMLPPRLLLASLILLSLGLSVQAQGDPFGGPDPFGTATPAANAAANEQPVDSSPLTRQLLEHSSRGAVQKAMAIASLARTGRWAEANQLLSGATALDTPTLATMFKEIGPALFFRMKQSDQLSDAAKSALDQMASAATASAESSARLREAIDGLDAASSDTRLASSRALIRGGTMAVAELAAAAVSPAPTAPREIILRALIEFDDFGVSALQQLALYGQPDTRTRALQALGWIDRKGNLPAFVSALHGKNASQSEKQTAMRQLERLSNNLPTLGASIQILEEDFLRRRAEANETDNDDRTTLVWNVAEDGQTVSAQPTTTMLAAYRDVADAGARLHRLKGLPAELDSAVLSSDLAYRLMVDPDWGDTEQIDEIRQTYETATAPPALSAALGESTKSDDHPATIGLLRLIDTANATEQDRVTLLTSYGAKPTPLVMAANHSIPQVRYEAANIAAALAEQVPYAGSSMVRKTLAEMTSLGDQPTAILVETRPEVVIRVETILSKLGYATCVVHSVRQLQRIIDRGGDIRLILSKIELSDLPPVEMVDLVRRTARGRNLPILFYGPEDPALMWKRWNAPTVLTEMPSSAAGLYDVLDTVRRNRRLPALTVIDRQHYRDTAELKPSS